MKIYSIINKPEGLGYDNIDYEAIYQSGYSAGYESGFSVGLEECEQPEPFFEVIPTFLAISPDSTAATITVSADTGTSWEATVVSGNPYDISFNPGSGSGYAVLDVRANEAGCNHNYQGYVITKFNVYNDLITDPIEVTVARDIYLTNTFYFYGTGSPINFDPFVYSGDTNIVYPASGGTVRVSVIMKGEDDGLDIIPGTTIGTASFVESGWTNQDNEWKYASYDLTVPANETSSVISGNSNFNGHISNSPCDLSAWTASIDFTETQLAPVPPTPSGYSGQHLTFEILSDGWMKITRAARNIQYSVNAGPWTTITGNSKTVQVSTNDIMQFKGENEEFSGVTFRSSGLTGFNVYGNIMSLIYGDDSSGKTVLSGNVVFQKMFQNCTIIDASGLILPATTLTDYCYQSMFSSCSAMTAAPALPATTLTPGCYRQMFAGCGSLAQAPELPATTLAEGCYLEIFQNCYSITTAPVLPATTLARGCYRAMFYNCTALTQAPVLPATEMVDTCYAHMFRGCTSLTTAPELPATILADSCYQVMFSGCTNLNYIKCLATDISASYCTNGWMSGVQTTSGTFIKHPNMSSWETGENGIPDSWTVVDASE